MSEHTEAPRAEIKRTVNAWPVIILVAVLAIAWMSRYELVPVGTTTFLGVYKLDRLTGQLELIIGTNSQGPVSAPGQRNGPQRR